MKANRTLWMFCMSFIMRVECQDSYCSFSPQHTLCQYQGVAQACGQPLGRGVSEEERRLVVDHHNRLRSRVATGSTSQPPASNMMELQWDEELARVAQRLADQCKFAHDCSECRRVARFRVGQNLYQSFTTRQGSSSDWIQATDAWFNEIELFPSSSVGKYVFSPSTGHYSQLVWATTTRVGCGLTEYKSGRFISRLFVCNYGEGGNLIKAPVYKTGDSCTSCPASSSCSTTYPGLCSAGSAQTRPKQPAAPTQTRPIQPAAPAQTRPARPTAPEQDSSPLIQPVSQQFSPSQSDLTPQNILPQPSSPSNVATITSCTSFFCLFSNPSIMVNGLMDTAHTMGDTAMTTVQSLSDFVIRFNSGFFG